jgi:hypothetical protein
MHLADSRLSAVLAWGLACVVFSGPLARFLVRSKKPGGVDQPQEELKTRARSVRWVGNVLLVLFAVLMVRGG